jgi:diguanylate cyclase (GGDEF)-like protein
MASPGVEWKFAALIAASEAALRARSPEELFQRVADAVVDGRVIDCAGVLLTGDDNRLRLVAAAGGRPERLDALGSASDAASSDGAALIPILRRGSRIGVFAFCPGRLEAFDDLAVDLLRHIAQTVSSGLDRFERETEQGRAAQANERLDRRFRLLNATNQAILNAHDATEMFQMVCDAATGVGQLLGASVLLHDPVSSSLMRAACSGRLAEIDDGSTISADPARPGGRLVSAEVFRTGQACFINDIAADPRAAPWRSRLVDAGAIAGAALPLVQGGRVVGVCSFFFGKDSGPLDDDGVELTTRICQTLSFGAELFERQQQKHNITRMFVALSATNEAIMRARTRDELFELVCEAAVNGGEFTATLIGLTQPGSDFLRIAASAGPTAATSRRARLAITPEQPEGRGLSGRAFVTGRPCISNDYLAEIEEEVLRQTVEREGTRSGAAFPLLSRGRAVGVLLFMSSERGAFTPELVELLERLAENISFALDNFDRADDRRLAGEQKERVTRMFAALSATNESIMRAATRAELFRLVCEAAVQGGPFISAVVALAQPGSDFLRIAATAGPDAEASKTMTLAVTAERPEGRGLSGTAFRTHQPCIANDYLADPRAAAFHERARQRGGKSCAALPLLSRGEAVGVLVFLSNELGAFTPELVELLQRLTENVSFALENFSRADDRRLADKQRERITRMFAALSATNEAIMRARTRHELFGLVCEAAVHGGRFASTVIALTEPGEEFLRVVAFAGPNGELQKTVKIAITDERPEGRGLSGLAFRTLQPCISNDYLADARGEAFHERARREGNKSGASLPLLSHGRAVGVLVFLSSERDAFTPELVELLMRLASNVSFALDNFDRADEKATADERIKYLATHDGLTGLPNRATFNHLLHSSIESARRLGRSFAVLFIDIDRFKVINDSLGHDAGDALLVETSDRLRRALRGGDVVARLGGDEFVIILEHASESRQIEAAARKILSVVGQPIHLCGLECRATASIGIAVFPNDGEDEQTLTKNADMAMYRAKEEGKNGFRFFVRQSKMQSVERLVFEARLRQALDRDEFSLHYQPKIELAGGRVTGVEALLRWTLPDLGVLPPMQFIALAEETGLIVPIGRWVLQTACAQNAAWRRQGLPPLSMAVNLSPRQFSHENLLQDIDDALAASGMPGELLQLEITESMVMHNVPRAIELLEIIRGRGVRLAIDDFGTGYSSMSLMKRFPVDTIKIDRSFVQDLPDDAEDRAIAQAIISMGKALGLTVIAEGVETADQAAFLREHGCDEMQGYLFSKPVPPERIPDLLRSSRLFVPPLQALEPASPAAGGREAVRRVAASAARRIEG